MGQQHQRNKRREGTGKGEDQSAQTKRWEEKGENGTTKDRRGHEVDQPATR